MYMLRTLASDGLRPCYLCLAGLSGEIETWDMFHDFNQICQATVKVTRWFHLMVITDPCVENTDIALKSWHGIWSMMKEDIYRAARRKSSEADTRCHKRYMGQNLERRGILPKLVSHVLNTSSRVNEFRTQYKEYNVPIHDLSIPRQGKTRQMTIYLASCSTNPLQFRTVPISSYLISQL